jgi:SAM-dependent methyltransferase
MDPAHAALNRRAWDERVGLHVTSEFYDLEGIVAGRSSLHPFEADELGEVDGCDLVHLQCHLGTDTISWARLGASVTGLDFSEPAIDAARSLAERCGIEARFVVADVYDAPDALGATYDVVYTGLGALCWLKDLHAWAKVVDRLLRPGGRLYLLEFHPLLSALSMEGPWLDPTWGGYFFEPEGFVDDSTADYASGTLPSASTTIEWAHPLGDVVTTLVEAGFEIRRLVEHDVIAYAPWDVLEPVPGEAKIWRLPAGQPKIPLEYSLLARKPM